MHDKRSPVVDPAAEDCRYQAAVLSHVLALYPGSLTLPELIREMTIGSTDIAERDPIERAVGELIGTGLIHPLHDLIVPTRAAVRYHDLTNA